jgi:hypothetical protein
MPSNSLIKNRESIVEARQLIGQRVGEAKFRCAHAENFSNKPS